MARKTGAREAHSLKIRTALVAACGDLLAKYPIDAITINQIVETAGVAKGSFYNHFPDKESLAATVSNAIREEIEERVFESNLNITDPAYKIARGVSNHVKVAVDDPRRAAIMHRNLDFTTSIDSPLNKNIQIHVSEGVESSRFEIRSEKTGIFQIIGATVMIMAHIIEKQLSAEESVELCAESLTLIFCGFGMSEEEGSRIAWESARDIIIGS